MHLNPAITRGANFVAGSHLSPRRTAPAARPVAASSPEAVAEIHAYIAARDLALAEAEGQPTNATLTRAAIANELVENCTRPARFSYRAQSLPVAEASREQSRCEAVKARLAQLRHRAAYGQHRFECAAAA
ncbi:MAG: hypothetical protein H0V56_00490 [Chthoniobacterales bacterium]|nr:hypothetical protein [Chthoniobacterales bacterium]